MANFKETVGEVLDSKPVQVISTALLTTGIATGYLSQTEYRHMMPRFIGEHAGNFVLSSLPVISFGAICSMVEDYARQTDNQKLEQFAQKLYPLFVALVVGGNMVFESQFLSRPLLFKENAGDFTMGIIAIAVGMLAVRRMRKNIISDIT